MSLPFTINGTTFPFPEPGDRNWGAVVTSWASSVTSGMLQKAGGSFPLAAEVDFGAAYGLKAVSYKSRGTNVAAAGVVRLASAETISWRNAANGADLALTTDGSDRLTFNGTVVQNALSVSDTSTIDLTLIGASLSAAVLAGSISNTHIAAAAAVAFSKMEPLTVNRVLQTNSSGFAEASSVATTTLAFLDATSSVQTQLNARLPLSGGTLTGSLILAGTPTADLEAATKAYVDAAVMGLSVRDSVRVATTANGTFNTAFANGQTVDGVVLATGNRILIKNQSTSSQNGIYIVASSGAPTRATDSDTWNELIRAFTFVTAGTANAGTSWVSQTIAGGTLGTDPVTFGQFGGAASYSADGNGLELIATTFSLELDGTTLSKSGSGLKVADLGVTNAQIATAAAIARSKVATGVSNRLVYNDAATGALADLSALTASRLLVSDSNGLPSALSALTASRVLVSDGSGLPTVSSVTSTTLGFLDASSSIQTQLNARLPLTGGTLSGTLTGAGATFTSLSVNGETVATVDDLTSPLLVSYSFTGQTEVAVTSVISSTYTVYRVELDLTLSTNISNLYFEVSRNNGSSYYTGSTDYTYVATYRDSSATTSYWASNGDPNVLLVQSTSAASTLGSVNLTLRIHKGSGTTEPEVEFHGKCSPNNGRRAHLMGCGGQSSIVPFGSMDAFKIRASVGTMTGVMKVYGVY